MREMKYLYHGSKVKVDWLEPRKAFGFGGEEDCIEGVYATEIMDLAIPFAFTLIDVNENSLLHIDTEKTPPVILLRDCCVNWNVHGYLYKLPVEPFVNVGKYQWVSKVAVQPIKVLEIDPRMYKEWVKYE